MHGAETPEDHGQQRTKSSFLMHYENLKPRSLPILAPFHLPCVLSYVLIPRSHIRILAKGLHRRKVIRFVNQWKIEKERRKGEKKIRDSQRAYDIRTVVDVFVAALLFFSFLFCLFLIVHFVGPPFHDVAFFLQPPLLLPNPMKITTPVPIKEESQGSEMKDENPEPGSRIDQTAVRGYHSSSNIWLTK